MSGLPDDCPGCGEDFEGNASFVRYRPDPNDAQEEAWGDKLPRLWGVVCVECGYMVYVYIPDEDQEPPVEETSRFQVDRELF